MDMKISGSGMITSGEYENIGISGSAKGEGLISCKNFSCSGAAKLNGELRCEGKVNVSGSFHAEKSISAGEISVSGSVKTGGDCKAKEKLSVSGSCVFEGDIKCNVLKAYGGISAKNIEAENADIQGKINADGLINAEEIKIKFESSSSAESIGGGRIVIFPRTHSKPMTRLPLISKIMGKAGANCFTVKDSIEGDEIALENVTAEKVSGRVVAIGAGCKISSVKYTETIEISPDAEVGTYEKI